MISPKRSRLLMLYMPGRFGLIVLTSLIRTFHLAGTSVRVIFYFSQQVDGNSLIWIYFLTWWWQNLESVVNLANMQSKIIQRSKPSISTSLLHHHCKTTHGVTRFTILKSRSHIYMIYFFLFRLSCIFTSPSRQLVTQWKRQRVQLVLYIIWRY